MIRNLPKLLILILTIFWLLPEVQATSGNVVVSADLNFEQIQLKYYPEKRLPASNNWATISTVELRDCMTDAPAKTYTNVETNSAGFGEINIPDEDVLAPGNYRIYVKGYSHLKRAFNCYSFEDTVEYFDLSLENKLLRGGDTANPRNNRVDLADLNHTGGLINTSDYGSDLNQDGEVNSLDLSILTFNFNEIGD